MWLVAPLPTEPLTTDTVWWVSPTPDLITPLIGPSISPFVLLVNPTLSTFIYSSSILKMSLGWIDEMPLTLNVLIPAGIPPEK